MIYVNFNHYHFFLPAPNLHLSRKQLLRIFREAMNLAENQVDSGIQLIPLPENLFTLNNTAIEENDDDCESMASDEILQKNEELLVIRRGEQADIYKLPPRGDVWDNEDECENEILYFSLIVFDLTFSYLFFHLILYTEWFIEKSPAKFTVLYVTDILLFSGRHSHNEFHHSNFNSSAGAIFSSIFFKWEEAYCDTSFERALNFFNVALFLKF